MVTTKSVLFGEIFTCLDCNKLVFLRDGQEYTKEECIRMSDELKPYCKREGVSLLTMSVENMKCFQCKEQAK